MPCLGPTHQLFRVPLHRGQPPVIPRPFEPLDHSVRGVRGDTQTHAGTGHRLVMTGVRIERRRAEQFRKASPGRHVDGVRRGGAVARLVMLERPGPLRGKVLHERPAERDVHDLDAAAYGERRESTPVRRLEERQLPRVAMRVRGVGPFVAWRTVVDGVDVLAACEDQPIGGAEDFIRGGAVLERRRHERHHAGILDRLEIRDVQAHALDAIDRPGGRGKEDEGTRGHDACDGGGQGSGRRRPTARICVAGTSDGPVSYRIGTGKRVARLGDLPAPGRILPAPGIVFDEIKQALHDLLHGNVPSEGRRDLLAAMKETLVHARLGLDDLREGVATTRGRLDAERRELETVRRRKGLAQQIGDAETVAVAERFESQHAERVSVLEQKLAAQEQELTLTRDEIEEMTRQFKAAAAGVGSGMPSGRVGRPDAAEPDPGDARSQLERELDSLGRAQRRASADAEADARLAELKRRMGK